MSKQFLLQKGERAFNLESSEAVATLRDRTITVVNAVTGMGEKHKTLFWREMAFTTVSPRESHSTKVRRMNSR